MDAHSPCPDTRKDGAGGVDGQTAAEYEVNLEADLQNLLDRAKSGTYVAHASASSAYAAGLYECRRLRGLGVNRIFYKDDYFLIRFTAISTSPAVRRCDVDELLELLAGAVETAGRSLVLCLTIRTRHRSRMCWLRSSGRLRGSRAEPWGRG